ncbi:dephospho-CoA kinase [Aurantiacibacter sediminis]|uniref:Dephospho-CoA kinase n=1 Tax=Aurantiacibacter sediminis TaxID=2793064 RepID=A0ABS0N277_9SPHN|nr:dephospho-CoA kinase [Aurantiacibacter sediminis]MBH5321415.1 dephospho-CoA kinase [Aurantiacibacter sediminis]
MSEAKRPFILGLTGSIAMGKSTVAQMLRDCGVPVFDADHEVRAMQGPGGELLPAIEQEFPGTTGPDGVNRPLLGAQVFGNPERLAALEAIVHPAVAKRREAFARDHHDADLIVFDIPLLFEKGSEGRLDAVAVVSAPAEMQRQRVLARENMTEEKFAAILAAQMPDAEKRARADFIVETGVPLDETRAQVEALVDKLRPGPHPDLRA